MLRTVSLNTYTLRTGKILGLLLAAIALIFVSWNKLPGSFAYRSKAGSAAWQVALTHHQLNIDGVNLPYHAAAGYLPLKDKSEQTLANIFYVAYTAATPDSVKRPITFVFNGGPGSASIWLHMGSFGPVRVVFQNDKGDAPANNYQYAQNPYTWLGFTDLVFIDPVSTGYSRAGDGVDARRFYSYSADISSIGQFIKLYLEQHHRQNSPKFLAGESYGSVRAVGLAEYLQEQHISLNGITLISPALNYQLINFHHGNETPYGYYLPSYAVAAQYHNLLSPELQKLSPEALLRKVTGFAQGTYTLFLNHGDMAAPALTSRVIDSLNYFTGLPKSYLQKVNGRISDSRFTHALLQNSQQVTGTFDVRFTGTKPAADPSETNLRGLFTAAFDQYIATDLGYHNLLPYQSTIAMGDWNYGPDASNSYLDVSETLRKVMNNNPNLKVNVVGGYYDLATPVGSTDYVIRHLGLKPELRSNISLHYYRSGHMVYISGTADKQLLNDSKDFYGKALNASQNIKLI